MRLNECACGSESTALSDDFEQGFESFIFVGKVALSVGFYSGGEKIGFDLDQKTITLKKRMKIEELISYAPI